MTQNEIQDDTQIKNQKEMIRTGEHQELYHQWAKESSLVIRLELAFNGYELDTLINDQNVTVRRVVMYNRPKYIKQRYKYEDPEDVFLAIPQLTELDMEVLMSQLDYWRDIDKNITKALTVKKELLTYESTEIEKQ